MTSSVFLGFLALKRCLVDIWYLALLHLYWQILEMKAISWLYWYWLLIYTWLDENNDDERSVSSGCGERWTIMACKQAWKQMDVIDVVW
jgi:hypothetical protein